MYRGALFCMHVEELAQLASYTTYVVKFRHQPTSINAELVTYADNMRGLQSPHSPPWCKSGFPSKCKNGYRYKLARVGSFLSVFERRVLPERVGVVNGVCQSTESEQVFRSSQLQSGQKAADCFARIRTYVATCRPPGQGHTVSNPK